MSFQFHDWWSFSLNGYITWCSVDQIPVRNVNSHVALVFFLVIFPKNDQTIPYLWSCDINMQVIQRDHLDSLGIFFPPFIRSLHHQQKGRIFHIFSRTLHAFLSCMDVCGSVFLLNQTELQKKTQPNILQDELFCLAISFLLVQANGQFMDG